MVVGYNEEKLLPACLSSLWFCDEIFYTDLGSNDSSIEIASTFTDKILVRNKVPSCEFIQTEVVDYLKNDWVIFIDPDEVIDNSLATCLFSVFRSCASDQTIGAITVPWQFYFKTHKLLGTIWGGCNQKYLLVNRKRFSFLPITHYGRVLKKDFREIPVILNSTETNILHHYWMNSYIVFLKKHQRYLKNEGKDEYDRGRRVSLKKIILAPFNEFYFSLITKKGYKDKLVGLFLSLYWSYYRTSVYIGIYKVQKRKSI